MDETCGALPKCVAPDTRGETSDRGVERMVRSISGAQGLDNTTPKKHRSGSEPLAALLDLTRSEIEPQTLRTDSTVSNNCSNRSVSLLNCSEL